MSNKEEYSSPTGRGVDVSSVRLDDLDKACLEEVKDLSAPTLLDLGCGRGGFSKAVARAGAVVTAVDQFDFSAEFTGTEVTFVQVDLRELSDVFKNQKFDVVYSQRTIHYLTHQDAFALLSYIRPLTDRLYISATGLRSEAANGYEAAALPVAERFHVLAPEAAEKLSMHEPVCLYSKAEFEALLQSAGFKIERSWESAFGNIKIICH